MAFYIDGGFLVDDEGVDTKYEILDTIVDGKWTTILVKDFWDCGDPEEYMSISVVQMTEDLEQPLIAAAVEVQLSSCPGTVAIEFPDKGLVVMGPIEFAMFNKACAIVSEFANKNGDWENYVKGYPEEGFQ